MKGWGIPRGMAAVKARGRRGSTKGGQGRRGSVGRGQSTRAGDVVGDRGR